MARLTRLAPIFFFTLSLFGQRNEEWAQRQTIRSFYSTVLTFREPGIPSRIEIRKLKGVASQGLIGLLGRARQSEALYARKTKDQVPPLVESRLFFSLFEGAQSLEAVIPERDETFLVELSYADSTGQTHWKDRVFLVKESRRWRVDDIAFLGEWAFGGGGRLQDTLRAVIQTADETPQE